MSDASKTKKQAPDATEARDTEEIQADIEQTRSELGDTVEALAAKTDVKARAHDKVDEAKARVNETVSGFGEKARDAAPDSAAQGASQAAEAVKRNPQYVALAGAFVAGIVAGRLSRGR